MKICDLKTVCELFEVRFLNGVETFVNVWSKENGWNEYRPYPPDDTEVQALKAMYGVYGACVIAEVSTDNGWYANKR